MVFGVSSILHILLKNSCILLVLLSVCLFPGIKVHAASATGTASFAPNPSRYWNGGRVLTGDIVTLEGINLSEYTIITGDYNASCTSTKAVYFRSQSFELVVNGSHIPVFNALHQGSTSAVSSFTRSFSFMVVVPSADSYKFGARMQSAMFSSSDTDFDLTLTVELSNIQFFECSESDSDAYQNGYNSGFDDGESAGYSSGYSVGYSDGESDGYDSGYQAGVDSVDTDSYYDKGYQAGYNAAFVAGYDEGYSSGYDDAMARVEEWGADTSEYPVYLGGFSVSDYSYADFVNWYWPVDVDRFLNISELNSFIIDPNHTYKFVVDIFGLSFDYNRSLEYRPYWTSVKLFLDVNGSRYVLSARSSSNTDIYVPGDLMSTSFDIGIEISDLRTTYHENTYEGGEWIFSFDDLNVMVYDCGPSGDTQNHIANQTDDLTNGYDSNSGSSMNDSFSSGVDDYQVAEDSLFVSAKTGLNDFEFYDLESVPAMLTGISFVGSVMTSMYDQAGGVSGIGIVLSILFSVMIAAMALGLYRWYQSRGGKK